MKKCKDSLCSRKFVKCPGNVWKYYEKFSGKFWRNLKLILKKFDYNFNEILKSYEKLLLRNFGGICDLFWRDLKKFLVKFLMNLITIMERFWGNNCDENLRIFWINFKSFGEILNKFSKFWRNFENIINIYYFKENWCKQTCRNFN